MHRTLFSVAIALTLSAGSLAAAPAAYKEPLDAQTLNTIKSEFDKLMELANHARRRCVGRARHLCSGLRFVWQVVFPNAPRRAKALR